MRGEVSWLVHVQKTKRFVRTKHAIFIVEKKVRTLSNEGKTLQEHRCTSACTVTDTSRKQKARLCFVDDYHSKTSDITDFLVNNLGLSTYEVNEFWTTVKKNKKTLSPKVRREIMKATHGRIPA